MKQFLTTFLALGCTLFLFHCRPTVDVEEDVPPLEEVMEVEDPFQTSFTTEFDAFNPEEEEYPGGRGVDELVVYTPDATKEKTGTNQWGVEAIVENSMITRIQDNNNLIPEDGFIISGHEEARLWILDNLELGMKAELDEDEKMLSFTSNTETRLRGMESLFAQMKEIRKSFEEEYSEEDMYLQDGIYEQIEWQIEEARQLLDHDQYQDLQDDLDYLDTLIEQGFNLTAVSPAEDFRGVWDRLTFESEEEIIEYLDALEAHGYNMLFPETYYYGKTIYPSDILEQHPPFEGWDPLEVLIEEAHKRDIEVHAWVHVAFVGFEDSPLVEEYSDWLMQTKDGVKESIHENDFYYFSWSVQEANDFLIDIYKELAEKYPSLDGIHFDYIRWPLQIDDHYFGYHPETTEGFEQESGIDPMDISPDDEEEWTLFQEYKEGLITSFLEEMLKEIASINDSLAFSGAVASPLDELAREQRNQNWGKWAEQGLFHFLTPMIYTYDSKFVYEETEEAVEKADGNTIMVSGLATYQGQEPLNVYRQVHQARAAGSPGYVSFSWSSSDEQQRRIHRYAINRNPATPPPLP